MKSSFNETTPKIVGGALIGFIALAAVYVFILEPINDKNNTANNSKNTTSTIQPSPSESTVSNSPAASTPNTAYKNGTYSATISYMVPKSDNSLTVQMTIENDKVTTVKTTHDYSDRESDIYISNFDSLIEEQVTGKNIGDLSIGRLGGASLTSNAFEDAIATIKNEAKS